MTSKTQSIYDLAIKDESFDGDMLTADPKDSKPGFWDGDMVRTIYASMYYAWYLGKNGVEKTKNAFQYL